ncbi:MAG: sodium/proline symporter PutP [Bacillota bacterium]|nr:sodium/proline symporter PutP [Bacillota bacterium]
MLLFVIILYFIGMSVIGYYFYKRTQNLSDYILGGRSLNPWVAAMSASASDMSGWLLLGLPGWAFSAGFGAVWMAFGLFLGTYLNWKFVAKRLRIFSERAGDSLTLSSYFQKRFKSKSVSLRVITSVFILFFFLTYTASGLVASAKLFNVIFNVPYLVALAIGVIAIVLYTFLGGFMAVSWTDLFQGILMFFAIMIVPMVVMGKLGGYGNAVDIVGNIDPNMLKMSISATGGIAVISSIAWGLGYFGQPHILVRFMAARDPEEIKTSRTISIVWVFLTLGGSIFTGILGRAYYGVAEGFATETVFIQLIADLFPALIGGILISAILAAIMSTADSQLLVSSSAFVEDIYKVVAKKEMTDSSQVWMSRFVVLIIAAIAYLLAMDSNSSVLELVSYAWAGLGATFGPAVLFSLYFKKTTYNGTFAGILAGGVTIIIWKNFLSGGIFDLYEIVPAFIISSLVIWLVSNNDKENQDEEYFDELAK